MPLFGRTEIPRLASNAPLTDRHPSIFRKSGHRFSVENRIKQTNPKRIPVPLNRDALQLPPSAAGFAPPPCRSRRIMSVFDPHQRRHSNGLTS
jgi:hypothetical protein